MAFPYFPNYMNYQQPQQQQGGQFVSVPNEITARNYPINPGSSITFVDENAPYCYTKTASTNPIERPIFKRYRLVEETDIQPEQAEMPDKVKSDIMALKALYDALRADIEKIKGMVIEDVKPPVSAIPTADNSKQ